MGDKGLAAPTPPVLAVRRAAKNGTIWRRKAASPCWTIDRGVIIGTLVYGLQGSEFDFDDRVLAHLQVVFTAKMRRRESFMFVWRDDPSVGDGRSAAWIDSSIPLYFRYSGGKQPVLNMEWLEEMSIAAGSTQGLVLGEEPGHEGEGVVRAHDNSMKRRDHPAN